MDSNNHWVHDKDAVQKIMVDNFTHLFTDDGISADYNIPSGICAEFSNDDWAYLT